MSRFDPKFSNYVKTDAGSKVVERFHDVCFHVSAANAVAASANGVLPATILTAAVQSITTGITSPAVPRALSIVGNVSGITGNVVVSGKNYAGEAIAETIALNGTTTVYGTKAFKGATSIDLPIKAHSGVAQAETATAAGTVSTTGNASVVVTAAGMTGSPKTISVAVVENDDASAIAGKIRAVLAADAAVVAMFAVSGATDKVILTRLNPAANDTTLNIAIADGTSVGVTTATSSANTTAGVPYDLVSVGWSDVLGLPYKLPHNTVLKAYHDNALEGTAPTVTTSSTAIEGNTVDLDTALNGKVVDVYLIV
jgi:hypothetical protein